MQANAKNQNICSIYSFKIKSISQKVYHYTALKINQIQSQRQAAKSKSSIHLNRKRQLAMRYSELSSPLSMHRRYISINTSKQKPGSLLNTTIYSKGTIDGHIKKSANINNILKFCTLHKTTGARLNKTDNSIK